MFNTILGVGAYFLAPKLLTQVQEQKVNVIHASPGRVRLKCSRWKNSETAKNLTAVFSSIPIIKDVEASPITGSLLLTFYTETLTQEQFDDIVKNAVETSIATYPELRSDLMNILKNVINTIDMTFKKQTGAKADLDSLLSVVLIVNGLLGFSVNPVFSSTLLYWAYSIINSSK